MYYSVNILSFDGLLLQTIALAKNSKKALCAYRKTFSKPALIVRNSPTKIFLT